MNRFFETQQLPSDMSLLIFEKRNQMIQAEKEEKEFKNLINDDNLMAFTSENALVPSGNGYKQLKEIDIFRDGYNGNIWRYTNNGNELNKAETLKFLHENAMNEFYNTDWENFGNDLSGGGMVNKKVKKCEEKKVVLGKERCIYKVSDSKKDYMKYKGKLVPVSDYVKSMKKKK